MDARSPQKFSSLLLKKSKKSTQPRRLCDKIHEAFSSGSSLKSQTNCPHANKTPAAHAHVNVFSKQLGKTFCTRVFLVVAQNIHHLHTSGLGRQDAHECLGRLKARRTSLPAATFAVAERTTCINALSQRRRTSRRCFWRCRLSRHQCFNFLSAGMVNRDLLVPCSILCGALLVVIEAKDTAWDQQSNVLRLSYVPPHKR